MSSIGIPVCNVVNFPKELEPDDTRVAVDCGALHTNTEMSCPSETIWHMKPVRHHCGIREVDTETVITSSHCRLV